MNQTSDDFDSLVARVADEFRERLEMGERPDVEEFAARYPQIADVLRGLLPKLHLLECPPNPADTPSDSEPTIASILGDFRIIREVGRGGMGIVYEAEQISLGRRVALKVLPFAATMDHKRLQRFHNEARAAASLRHANIVSVHAVGSDRGVHFYAMEFIDGATVAQVVRTLHRPGSQSPTPIDPDATVESFVSGAASTSMLTVAGLSTQDGVCRRDFFRAVAQIGVQAAEALEHAHATGIVHRDIKPGNLMLDEVGHVWVTDFGLARFGVDSDLTLSGDLLGTLRYMSPEQALARHGIVDHRTDVYGLGTVLYELLAGRPVILGEDRQEIMSQIMSEEPRLLRQINPSIPIDLQTIVLKTLAKNPSARYAAAQDLAEDLRRFLDGEQIRARRPSVLEVATRSVFKNRASIALYIIGILTILIPLIFFPPPLQALIGMEQSNITEMIFFFLPSLIIAVAGCSFSHPHGRLFALALILLTVFGWLLNPLPGSWHSALCGGTHGLVIVILSQFVAWALNRPIQVAVLGALLGAGWGIIVGGFYSNVLSQLATAWQIELRYCWLHAETVGALAGAVLTSLLVTPMLGDQ